MGYATKASKEKMTYQPPKEYTANLHNGRIPMLKVCSKCGIKKRLIEFYWHKRRKYWTSCCRKCSSKIGKAYVKRSNYYKTMNYVFNSRGCEITYRCKYSGREVMPKLGKYLQDLYTKQEGRCYYTGDKMVLRGYLKNPKAMTVVLET